MPGMFDDLNKLTGQALAREAQRELYGRDCDGPITPGYDSGMEYSRMWGVEVGNAIRHIYNTKAHQHYLPRLLHSTHGPLGPDRSCECTLRFTGGFALRVMLADPRDDYLVTALILHRLMRRACHERLATYSHYP
jgi:hypothetical protein